MRPTPASSTSCTERDSPGSKRTAVPAGMSSRMRVRRLPVELERAVDVGERVVAADLDRSIAAVHDVEHDACAVRR